MSLTSETRLGAVTGLRAPRHLHVASIGVLRDSRSAELADERGVIRLRVIVTAPLRIEAETHVMNER